MATEAMPASQMKLLLNAEPFGFGPTAAIAECFPHLKSHFAGIGFAGKGHTLDLQRPLAYDHIHNLEEETDLTAIFTGYDVFVTALDFQMAALALEHGLLTIIYDPLTWYWQNLPPVIKQCHLYLCQDFWGVKARLETSAPSFGKVAVVPPLIPATNADTLGGKQDPNLVLLNLGGLANPFWPQEHTINYAKLILAALERSGITRGKKLIVAGNQTIARACPDFSVQTLAKEEMLKVLETAGLAFMTPGLGNIFDAARFGLPTIWLPPANDSQGQQLDLLEEAGLLDGSLDWHYFLPDSKIDYRQDQETVLGQVATAISKAQGNSDALATVSQRMKTLAAQVPQVSRTSALLHSFGSGGAAVMANHIAATARQYLNDKEHVKNAEIYLFSEPTVALPEGRNP